MGDPKVIGIKLNIKDFITGKVTIMIKEIKGVILWLNKRRRSAY